MIIGYCSSSGPTVVELASLFIEVVESLDVLFTVVINK